MTPTIPTPVPTRTSRWRPLLEGPAAERAWATIAALASEIRDPDAAVPDASIANGHAGLALLHAALDHAGVDGPHAALAEHHIDAATEAVAQTPMTPGLYAGFTGVAFAIELLRSHAGSDEDPCGAIDEALLELLDGTPWTEDYDLISGLVGFGVYALKRLPSPAAVRCVERIVEHLDAMAERRADGITWWTPRELIPAAHGEDGYYNLGLAHGVPGVVALLGQVCAAGVATRTARELLDGSVAWLLAQRLPVDAGALFPSWVRPDDPPSAARTAWCYGDPGVAAALFIAARCVGEKGWEQEALNVARSTATRSFESSGVRDAGLCHGAAGLGHVFNRLYQFTGDESLGEAARSWFERALAMHRPGEGVGGFLAFMPESSEGRVWVPDPGLLTGASGIGLALLAAVTPIEPTWDAALLLSGCPA